MLQGEAIIINPNNQLCQCLQLGLTSLSVLKLELCLGSSVMTAASWVVKPHPFLKVIIYEESDMNTNHFGKGRYKSII